MKIQGVCQLETSLKSAGQIQLTSVHLLLKALAVYLDQQTKEILPGVYPKVRGIVPILQKY